MKCLPLLGGLAIASLVASAQSQTEDRPAGGSRPGGGGLMAALDQNGDGKLTPEELDRAVVALRSLDRNEDGDLTGDEVGRAGQPADRPGGGPRRGGQLPDWDEIDSDGDGKVSRDEAPDRMKQRWDRMDSNGDGFIDKGEQEAMNQFIRRMRQGGGERGGQGAGRNNEAIWRTLAERFDKDEDGAITFAEYARSRERFDQLDKDGDGNLTKDDLGGRRNAGAGNTVRGPDGPPQVGDHAPDFELPFATREGTAQEGAKAKLSSFKEKKPVALIFGSYT